ncbi:MAG: hypothetical protein PUE25_07820 [bacterium]|nr:hypothetical protein [bacterium]
MCVKGGIFLPVVACHNRPSEAHRSGCSFLQAALGFASLAWSCPRYAISDGRFRPLRRFDAFVAWVGWWDGRE